MKRAFASISFVFLALVPAWSVAQETPVSAKTRDVVELFEDDAEGLLNQLTNPGDGQGAGEAEATVVFSGKKSLKITHYQRFHRALPGWNHAIREKPKPGEFRYLRLAWKSGGATTMMLQLHDLTDWHIRYTAGPNPYGWQTRFVADKAPAEWKVVTIDLFKDFGERTLTGVAFTIHGGAGYFDHVYLGRSVEDLDRIDANGLGRKEIPLDNPALDRLWRELAAEDAAIQYHAFWTLVGGRERTKAFITRKLAPPEVGTATGKQVAAWIRELNSGSFSVRENSFAELKSRLETVGPFLEAELSRSPPLEARRRIQALIALLPARDQEQTRRMLAQRVLAYIATATKQR